MDKEGRKPQHLVIAVVSFVHNELCLKVFSRKGKTIYSRTVHSSIQKPTVNHMALYLQETQR